MGSLHQVIFLVVLQAVYFYGHTASNTTTAPAATPAPTAAAPRKDVAITASPSAIHDGFTKYLTINCTYNHRQSSSFSTIMSLILSKTANPQDTTFQEVASVTAYAGDVVDTTDDLGADVEGHLEHMSVSYIFYEWKYPPKNVEGQYRCQAFGMDNKGHPQSAEAIASVTEKAVDMNMILENMKKMDNELDDLLHFKDDVTSRLAGSMAAIMEFTKQYQGRTYSMSHPMVRNAHVAASMCQLYGQNLLEINDQPELDFIEGFVKANAADESIALGVSDEKQEGKWTYMSNGQTAFTKFGSGWGNGGSDKNCLYLSVNGTTAMFDDVCFGLTFDRFVCEDQ